MSTFELRRPGGGKLPKRGTADFSETADFSRPVVSRLAAAAATAGDEGEPPSRKEIFLGTEG